ncbi:MAG: hypothetical protein ACO2PM_17580 [Pyrobaculum sp.]
MPWRSTTTYTTKPNPPTDPQTRTCSVEKRQTTALIDEVLKAFASRRRGDVHVGKPFEPLTSFPP